jgi:hypothetical protein
MTIPIPSLIAALIFSAAVLSGCVTATQLNPENAKEDIYSRTAWCRADRLEIVTKNDKKHEYFYTCASTKTYIESCVASGLMARPEDKIPIRIYFTEIKSIKRFRVPFAGRCLL